MHSPSFYFFKYFSYVALVVIVVYTLGWATNQWPGDVELLLTGATAFCGIYWILDKTMWSPARGRNNPAVVTRHEEHRLQRLAALESTATAEDRAQLEEELADELDTKLAPPPWINNTAGCFLVLLLVWGVRSFLWEPFYVPSGSMVPTLRTGDAIAVNKWSEGIRIPATNIWLSGPRVERGDPIVFRYPEDPDVHFIKRVVAIEGDTITYRDKTVAINGRPLVQYRMERDALGDLKLGDESITSSFFSETPPSSLSYTIQLEGSLNTVFEPTPRMVARWPDACLHEGSTVTCKVPARHAFVMGDNRDNSFDSRFWGFVPYGSIKGKATRYLFNAKLPLSSKPFAAIR